MQRNLSFKIVVTDDDNDNKLITELGLPYDSVSNIVSNLADSSELNEFYLTAAMHPAPNVRESVAWKDKISEDTFKILAEDDSTLVLRSLSRSEAFKKYADDQLVRKLIELDSDCAQNIAGNLEALEQVDFDEIMNLLINARDPSIRYSVASNYSTPKRILKILINDRDLQVSQEAKKRLEN